MQSSLVLFDIDGTLISTAGAGTRSMTRAFRKVYGIPNAFREVNMAGKTDPVILREALQLHETTLPPPTENDKEQFYQAYIEFLPEELILSNENKKIFPGIVQLLHKLKSNPAIVVGLLTGNWKMGARLKLEHFKLWSNFCCGAFADDSQNRQELLPFAQRRAEKITGHHIPPHRIFVIGDTPRDVEAAKPHGATTVAVSTGVIPARALRKCDPDYFFNDFHSVESRERLYNLVSSGSS